MTTTQPCHAAHRRAWLVSLLVGLAALAAGSLAVPPARPPLGALGAGYAALASAPFGHDANPAPARILTPLVSWLVGLRGDRVTVTVLIACCALPILAARWAVARGGGAAGAGLAAGCLTTTLVVRTSLHCGAYPDVVTYLGLFGVWAWRARPRLASACWLGALLDHERALALGPWVVATLWLAAADQPPRRRWAWLGPLLAGAIWLVVHAVLESRRPAELAAGSYLGPLLADPLHNLRPYGLRPLVGFYSALQWVWLVPFVWAVRVLRRRDWRTVGVGCGLPVLGAAAAMLVAYDWSRMATLAFPCLLPALADGLESGSARARRALAAVLVVQALWPQTFTAWFIVETMRAWALPW